MCPFIALSASAFMFKIKKLFSKIIRRQANHQPDTATLRFISDAFEEMVAQHKKHAASWPYGKEKGWTADLDAGVIVFKFAGDLTGTCHFQTIGTYNEVDGSFLWGWAHGKLPRALKVHAKMARQWGKTLGLSLYASKNVKCSMEEAWNFAAITQKLAGAKNVYRGRVGKKYIFMTTDDIHISNTTQANAHWSKGRRQVRW